MTLFKKVFQNQSQPATREDVLDEDALRRAFAEADAAEGPLDLDPFQCGDGKPEVEDHLAAAELTPPEKTSDLDVDADAFQLIDGAMSQEEDTSEWERREDPLQENDTDGERPDETLTHDEEPAQSDAEIAACLDRALAAEVPEEQPEEPAPTDTEEASDALAKADAVAEDTSAKVDLTQFAQQQMAASETIEDAAAAQAVPPAEKGVDLSAAGVTGLEFVPAPAAGRAGRRAGRVKTRLLGFNRAVDGAHNPFDQAPETTASAQREKYPVGWLVIVEGPGVGHSFSIFSGASMIGRGEDQVIRLDFGDNSISRSNHAAIAYDDEQNKFYIGHGGKSNIIRRNARPVLSTEELHHADLIRIGETTLRFVALCGSDFQWNISGVADADGV
ncbi:MAG: FHA domain-containing protein [Pseudomonadota bacterium]